MAKRIANDVLAQRSGQWHCVSAESCFICMKVGVTSVYALQALQYSPMGRSRKAPRVGLEQVCAQAGFGVCADRPQLT
eukprot:11216579-Lingulodinium_polyedra.AAC.1